MRERDATMLVRDNGLLSSLSPEDRAIVDPFFQRVVLRQGQVLFEADHPIPYAYFFLQGLSSEIVSNRDGKKTEVGCTGWEGFSGVPLVLGVDRTPHRAFMQAGGAAFRISAAELKAACSLSPAFHRVLLLYTHVFMIQIAATALADSRYPVNQRLARWLLMCSDRLGDELPLTHAFLALMLGVRRASVTVSTHHLEGVGAIKAERSLITVRDRAKLERIAGNAYGVPENEYERLIGQKTREESPEGASEPFMPRLDSIVTGQKKIASKI
ncbi:cyclic nucleotide-binding protein [Limoniibacter endophyticus]|uniref:Cyclic nucleotide-binding protein n=2 Tax=Limoniibacter endophyticus TaxID=1565040 RepID=A0A8J3DSR3_9HYPH|nr:cyclic nucleotide-binding protein [Limoniibacter endophyticus]